MEYIIKNKVSAYTVVYPFNAKCDERLAVKEFCEFVNKATGASVTAIEEKGTGFDKTAKCIFIGDTACFKAAGLLDCPEIGTRGFIIRTVENSVFVKGNTDTGTLNGVYRLLNLFIGFEPYGPDTPYYKKNIEKIEFIPYNITETPDIMYNMVAIGAYKGVKAKRMHFDENDWLLINDDLEIGGGGSDFHTSFHFLPPFIHKEKHPEWYSDDGTQLCLLAHGNKESLDEMYLAAFEVLKEHLKKNTTANRVCFTQQDLANWCECPSCKKLREQYGTDAASAIWFLNRLAVGVREWFADEGKAYARPFDICFLAYHATRMPPVKKDADGNYQPLDKSVILDEGVCPFYAPICADYHKSLDDDINAETRDALAGWGAISKRMYLWTYNTNFHYYLVPYDSFRGMAGTYRLLSKHHVYYLFDENQYDHDNVTGFTVLKAYLSSKLAWNSSLDIAELTDAFFRDYYGVAAGYMRQCYDRLLKHFDYMENTLGFTGYVFSDCVVKENYPKEFLTECIEILNKALKTAELIKSEDADTYRELRLRILTETISFRYLLIQLYPETYQKEELSALKQAFVNDAKAVNINRRQEDVSIEEVYKEWGIL